MMSVRARQVRVFERIRKRPGRDEPLCNAPRRISRRNSVLKRRTRSMNEDSITYDEWGRNPDAPLSAWLGGAVIAGYLKAVCATSSRIVPKTESNEKMSRKRLMKNSSGRSGIIIWGCPPFLIRTNYHLTCMASRSRDGELLAQVLSRFNTRCVRGSSSALDGKDKGGAAAGSADGQSGETGGAPTRHHA